MFRYFKTAVVFILLSFSGCQITATSDGTSSTGSYYSEGSSSSPIFVSVGNKRSSTVGDDYGTSYYYVYLTGGNTYTVQASNLSNSINLGIIVYSDSFNTGDVYSSSSSTSGESVEYTPSSSGYYYFTVYNVESAVGTNFDLDVIDSTPSAVSEGTISNPVYITLGSTHSGSVGTSGNSERYSYYSVYLTSGQEYTINVSNLDAVSDLDIYVYSDSNFYNNVATATNGSTSGETVSFIPSTSGYYYFYIYNYTNVYNTNFSLDVYASTTTVSLWNGTGYTMSNLLLSEDAGSTFSADLLSGSSVINNGVVTIYDVPCNKNITLNYNLSDSTNWSTADLYVACGSTAYWDIYYTYSSLY